MTDSNPIIYVWAHDALSNNESVVTDYTPEALAATASRPGMLLIVERADGTRELADPATVRNPSEANTHTDERK